MGPEVRKELRSWLHPVPAGCMPSNGAVAVIPCKETEDDAVACDDASIEESEDPGSLTEKEEEDHSIREARQPKKKEGRRSTTPARLAVSPRRGQHDEDRRKSGQHDEDRRKSATWHRRASE